MNLKACAGMVLPLLSTAVMLRSGRFGGSTPKCLKRITSGLSGSFIRTSIERVWFATPRRISAFQFVVSDGERRTTRPSKKILTGGSRGSVVSLNVSKDMVVSPFEYVEAADQFSLPMGPARQLIWSSRDVRPMGLYMSCRG